MASMKHKWAWFVAALGVFAIAGLARADWDPPDGHKMHFPQLPDPTGWDVCLVEQFIADDFTCSEDGPITDIHFWISYRADEPPQIESWDVRLFDDAGMMPGNELWPGTGGPIQGTVTIRGPYSGMQGWVCPSPPPLVIPNDHQMYWQVNIFDIQQPFVQTAGTNYWLVIKANLFMPPPPAVGWKTSVTDPPGPLYQAPAMWSFDTSPGSWQFVETYGQLHDMAFVITGGYQQQDKDYGDAPESSAGAVVLAYSDGTAGAFPTCINVGPAGSYIEHGLGWGHFGDSSVAVAWDFELDGNGGLCPNFAPYDNDECFQDGDSGLIFPEPYTLVGGMEVPCPNSNGTPLGLICQNATWGADIDIWVENFMPVDAWVNVLVDWDRDGKWAGGSVCPDSTTAPEWVLVNWPLPVGFVGPLSITAPPGFLIGPNPGHVWTRFSITEQPIAAVDWDGSGIFEDGETEDYLLLVDRGAPELEPKWNQPPHPRDRGFDAPSDYWWNEQNEGLKWEQLPLQGGVNYHAHDSASGTGYSRLINANDWRCSGGRVTDFHWWGAIEAPGSGLSGFHVSIHKDGAVAPCSPQDPPEYQADIPMSQITVTATGLTDYLGRPIYRYDFDLPPADWYNQEAGQLYWFDLCALSNDPFNPCMWLWQTTVPMLECPSMWRTVDTPPSIPPDYWHSFDNADFAFRVTSQDVVVAEVNKVVADDFISDGRPIENIYWAGSYLDPQYAPEFDPIEPYVLDGWFISFHHADPVLNSGCPPALDLGDPHPTVLGIYFAPAWAVTWVNLGYLDCNGHAVYDYRVDLSQCCLICSHVDPRADAVQSIPAQPEAFYETSGFGYWLDIQAVVGVTWDPPNCTHADRILTGHEPSPNLADGHFWGWHTSEVHNLNQACTGKILDMTPYPLDCWDYGAWDAQLWLCPQVPVEPVDMAFALMAKPCGPLGDVNWDGVLSFADISCFVDCLLHGSMPGCVCTCGDMDGSGAVDGLDIQWFVDDLVP